MKNRIDEQLALLKAAGRCGLMTHIVLGYPDLETSARLVEDMAACGADFIELQIPFSDPIADGPTIQHACEAALAGGFRVRDAMKAAAGLTQRVKIPLLFMTYYNIVHKYGTDKYCQDAAQTGISGLIVPDVPLEAAQHEGYLKACKASGLHNIPTLAPTVTAERLHKNAAAIDSFVYCMSRQGLTGAKQGFDRDLEAYIGRVRQHIKAPLALGFGISGRERLRAVLPLVDIAVVGSAAIDIIARSKPGETEKNVRNFITGLAEETRSGSNTV